MIGRSCVLETDWGDQEKAAAHFTKLQCAVLNVMYLKCNVFQMHRNSRYLERTVFHCAFLASQDAIEVMFVSDSKSYLATKVI